MRLIIKFNEYEDVRTWYRELDCADLPAQNGIVHTLGTLYHSVHICSVSPCQTSLEKECSRGYKTVLCLGAKEKMWTR